MKEQCRFAGAIWADHGDLASRFYRQLDAIEGFPAGGIRVGEIVDPEIIHTSSVDHPCVDGYRGKRERPEERCRRVPSGPPDF